MKPFEKFLNHTLGAKELLEIYLELRQEFQELGFSESNLEKPPIYTPKMMTLFHKFGDLQKALFKKVETGGFKEFKLNDSIKYLPPTDTHRDARPWHFHNRDAFLQLWVYIMNSLF